MKPSAGNLMDRLAKLPDEKVAEELYLAVLTRKPTVGRSRDRGEGAGEERGEEAGRRRPTGLGAARVDGVRGEPLIPNRIDFYRQARNELIVLHSTLIVLSGFLDYDIRKIDSEMGRGGGTVAELANLEQPQGFLAQSKIASWQSYPRNRQSYPLIEKR